jgi:hypothetical protein
MVVTVYQSTCYHIPEDHNLYNYCHENLESHTILPVHFEIYEKSDNIVKDVDQLQLVGSSFQRPSTLKRCHAVVELSNINIKWLLLLVWDI